MKQRLEWENKKTTFFSSTFNFLSFHSDFFIKNNYFLPNKTIFDTNNLPLENLSKINDIFKNWISGFITGEGKNSLREFFLPFSYK